MKKRQYNRPEVVLIVTDEQLMRKHSWRVYNEQGQNPEGGSIDEVDGDEIEVFSKKQFDLWADEEEDYEE